MKQKSFLNFLVQQQILTSAQIHLFLEQESSEFLDLFSKWLTQNQYLNSQSIQQYKKDFEQWKQASPLNQVSTPEMKTVLESENEFWPNPEMKTRIEDYSGLPKSSETDAQRAFLQQQNPLKKEQERESKNFFKSRYEVLETLGEGGMGVVQLVRDHLLGREVALKKIRKHLRDVQQLSSAQKSMLWRFQHEASITSILEHPNIVPLYDLQHNEQEEMYFTMRKIEGDTLRRILQQKRDEEEGSNDDQKNQLLQIFYKVCDAIAYAHSRGVIHRDLKPENIMVGTFGEVYVMDWGIAKQGDREQDQELLKNLEKEEIKLTTIGGLGTPGYMAPEQYMDASSVTPQADIYALGKILKECFTSLSPLEEMQKRVSAFLKEGKNPEAISLDYFYQESESNRFEEDSYLPKDVQAIIQKATQKNPVERYSSVKALLQDLENYQKNKQVSVREYRVWELVLKWFKRNSQVIRIFGAFFLFFMVFYFYVHWQQRQGLLKKIQENFQQVEHLENEAHQILESHTSKKGEKIGKLLFALNFLNAMLQLSPQDSHAQQKKWDLGTKLIQLCYETKDYYLATFLAIDLQQLKTFDISTEAKSKLLQDVEQKREETLKKHQARLTTLTQHFKNFHHRIPEPNELENALIEITRMQEEEIFQQLLKLFEEGTHYFLTNDLREPPLEDFYQMIAKALGYSERPEALKKLQEAFKKLGNNFIEHTSKTQSITLRNYIVTLVHILDRLNAPDFISYLSMLRWELGEDSVFSKQTQWIYQKRVGDIFQEIDQKIQQNRASSTDYSNRGLIRYTKNDFQGAIEDFNEALRRDPQDVSIYNKRGLAYYRNKNIEEAFADYTKAIQLQPQNIWAYNSRGVLNFNRGHVEEAIQDYTQALQIDSSFVNAYINRGYAYYFKKDFKATISDYDRAIWYSPDSLEAYYNRALAKEALQDQEGALKDYTQVLLMNHQETKAYTQRARILFNSSRFDEALQDLNQVIRLNPHHLEVYSYRAKIRAKKGDLLGAISDYSEAIRLNPEGNLTDYFNRSQLYHTQGEQEKALHDIQKAIQQNNSDPEAYNLRGRIYRRQNKLEEAILDLSQAIRLAPENDKYYCDRSQLYYENGEQEKALQDIQKAIQINTESAIYYNLRGEIYCAQDKSEEAFQDISKAIELDSRYALAYQNRGVLRYISYQQVELALEDLNKAIEIDPSDALFYFNRGSIYLQEKNAKMSRQDFQQYLQRTKAVQDEKIQNIRQQIYKKFPDLKH